MAHKTDSYKITTITGMALVVANMIGTGVFTSLGFQLKDLSNIFAILTLWLLGGIIALSGALSYAEIGTALKKSGGEYTFLSELWHPLIGYLSGWISITVGFAAPIALSAIACIEYLPIELWNAKLLAILLIALITYGHSKSLKFSAKFQNTSTILKALLIGGFIVLGLLLPGDSENVFAFGSTYITELKSEAFFIALIYVSYSYSGWNAAAYISEEFKNPARSLPKALIGGTLLVTTLYTLLQYVFLKHTNTSELIGRLEIGSIVMQNLLGEPAANVFGLLISVLLVSGISAMIWVGSRVTSTMSKEYKLWHYFKTEPGRIPKKALWLQFIVSTLLLLTGTFEQIMIYCGILLTLSSMLVVLSVFILRWGRHYKKIKGYKSPLFPFFQILYVLLSIWMIAFSFINYKFETLLGLINLLLGLGTYYLSKSTSIYKPKILNKLP
jgi:APA family basic amino acid/polyamine antiporter